MFGDACGVLTLLFDVPTTVFGFGVLQDSEASSGSVMVETFRPGFGWVRDDVTLETAPDPQYLGGRYTYEGEGAIKMAEISFSDCATRPRFLLDNIEYFRHPKGKGGN